jgi:hypothetical protein
VPHQAGSSSHCAATAGALRAWSSRRHARLLGQVLGGVPKQGGDAQRDLSLANLQAVCSCVHELSMDVGSIVSVAGVLLSLFFRHIRACLSVARERSGARGRGSSRPWLGHPGLWPAPCSACGLMHGASQTGDCPSTNRELMQAWCPDSCTPAALHIPSPTYWTPVLRNFESPQERPSVP